MSLKYWSQPNTPVKPAAGECLKVKTDFGQIAHKPQVVWNENPSAMLTDYMITTSNHKWDYEKDKLITN